MRRMLLAVAVLAAALGALYGCGLENTAYLDRPGDPVEALPGTPTFQVINVTTHDPLIFRGFELYYKFYSSDQDEKKTSESGLDCSKDELINLGFWRMCSPGKLSEQTLPYSPLIDVFDMADRTKAFATVLDFNLFVTPFARYGGTTERDIDITRYATDGLGETKKFDLSELDADDDDLASVTWTGSGQDLFLVIYTFSYGLQDLTTRVYSDARYLGFMQYHFP